VSDTGYYDDAHKASGDALRAAIRRDAFGEDIGQFSWLTADEHRRFFEWLGLDSSSHVLEVACGSGGPALFMAETVGCRVTGVDIHEGGVATASAAASERGLADRAVFKCVDARRPLPFPDAGFDAVICIDSINHMYERGAVLAEWLRVLRPGGLALFTDPIMVSGLLRREEMLIRSNAMGEFVFTPPGVDESLLREAGFADVRVEDVTSNMADVAEAWAASRERHRDDLERIEGTEAYAAFQHFLEVVGTLARERRLSRIAYVAARPEQ
jgi:SAM-dependent methyltransferase